MSLLILGLVLWWAVHLLPMGAPALRGRLAAKLGAGPWKGLFSLASLGAIALMVIGYRWAEYSAIYTPPGWGVHLNNLLMLVAVFLFGAGHARGRARRHVRHPMLWSVVVWAAAHLLVRGDLAAVILWGGMAAWALAAMVLSNARDGAWARPAGGTMAGDLRHVVITLVVFAVIALIHWKLAGVRPFPG